MRNITAETFLENSKITNYSLEIVSGDASFRSYKRVKTADGTFILMDAPPDKERVREYIEIAKMLDEQGYSVPKNFSKDEENGFLLLEDFGNALFNIELLEKPELEEKLYKSAVDVLVSLQNTPTEKWLVDKYTNEVLLREVLLFSQWYIPSVFEKNEVANTLSAEFEQLWKTLLANNPQKTNTFVHRDYHVSNLVWLENRAATKQVGLLDFQDALMGAPAYDLVSLLEDARRDVPEALQLKMLEYYLRETKLPRDEFVASYKFLGAQRNFKILGIFVRLAKRDGKRAYLKFIPRVWAYILKDLEHPALTQLKDWVNKNIASNLQKFAA